MSLKQYKNEADILASKTTIDGRRWSPTDFDLFITQKARAFEDPADQTIDYACEMHVYSPKGDWLGGDHRIESAKIPSINAKRRFLQLNLRKELEELGIERGSYKLVFNFMKSLLGNTENRSVFIKEISPNRKEVWLKLADPLQTELVPDDDIKVTLGKQFKQFSRTVNKQYNRGYSNLVLNLGNNNIFKIINARIGGVTTNEEIGETRLGKGQNIYLKLYNELPTTIVEKQRAWIAQEDKRPFIDSVNVYPSIEKIELTPIKGPNFEVDHDYAMQTETDFQSWNDLLDTTTGTTQQIIDGYFSGSLSGIKLNIDYTKFDNFVKYSSAEERIKNFRYKLQLIEHYDTQLSILAAASGSDSGSLKGNEAINTNRKNEVVGGFDAFERWAYNESTASLFTHGVSGSKLYAENYDIKPFPKYIENGQWKLHHSTSSRGASWLDGYITSASFYDLENEDSLINSIPENISRNDENSQYLLFVNMIGHHYDILYSYINELTRLHRTEEHPKLGVPGELLYDIAKSMGWQLSNGNQAESLWQYKLGKTVSGSYQSTGSMFSKSSEDISHEIWRRIVNNLPHILKTKGTQRSIHALMNTYGIPRTLLSIREYGGPKAPEQEVDLIEDRFAYALKFNPGAFVKTSVDKVTGRSDIHGTTAEIPIQTHQVRFKPGMTSSMLLMSGIYSGDHKTFAPNWHIALQHTASYSGSGKYGRIHFSMRASDTKASASMTDWLPIYDGDFWNLQLGYSSSGAHFNTGSNTDTTYKVMCQRAADYIKGKVVHSASLELTPSTGSHYKAWSASTQKHIILGGSTGSVGGGTPYKEAVAAALSASFAVPTLSGSSFAVNSRTGTSGEDIINGTKQVFSGSIQEYRAWTEEINKATFDIHTLNPTSYVGKLSATSSYHTLIHHYPLGSDTIAHDHSVAANRIISSSHPYQSGSLDWSKPYDDGHNSYATASGFLAPSNTQRGNYQRLTETYYVDAPSIGGTNTKSTKIRLESTKLVGRLDPVTMAERSRYDYASLDSNKLGLFYSAADWINKDIYNQIGAISLDNYFGDPADEFNVEYPDLEKIAWEYWKKYDRRNDINAYIKMFSLFDFSLFSQIKQLIPIRTDPAMGVLVEPNVLERAKVQISNQPIFEDLDHEQRISLNYSILTGSTVPLTASLGVNRPLSGSTIPLSASLGIERPLSGSTTPLSSSIVAAIPITGSAIDIFETGSLQKIDIEFAEPDLSGSSIISHRGSERQRDTVYIGQLGPTYSSSIVPSNYKLQKYVWAKNSPIYPGVTHSAGLYSAEQPVVVTDYALGPGIGNSLDVTYDRGVTASAAIQAVILEQRKSYNYSRKIYHYKPKDKATFHWKLDTFADTNRVLDSNTNYRHSTAYSQRAVNGTKSVKLGSAARFETISHNHFTGSALIFDCAAAQNAANRGGDSITIPRVRLWDTRDEAQKPGNWSVSMVIQPASGSGKTSIAIAGRNDATNPSLWIAKDGTLAIRDDGGMFFGSIVANTAPAGTKMNFNEGAAASQIGVQTSKERAYSIAFTFETSGSQNLATAVATAKFYVNGKLQHTKTRTQLTGSEAAKFHIDEIGQSYLDSGTKNTYGYSGSIAHFKIFRHHVLSEDEIASLNKYPHLRSNRDKKGNEIFTRTNGYVAARQVKFRDFSNYANRVKNTMYATSPQAGLPTSTSLEPADYRDDEFTGFSRLMYEGSKLTGPDFNINTTATTDGGPVVSFTITNPNTLTSKEGNLKVS